MAAGAPKICFIRPARATPPTICGRTRRSRRCSGHARHRAHAARRAVAHDVDAVGPGRAAARHGVLDGRRSLHRALFGVAGRAEDARHQAWVTDHMKASSRSPAAFSSPTKISPPGRSDSSPTRTSRGSKRCAPNTIPAACFTPTWGCRRSRRQPRPAAPRASSLSRQA